MTFNIRDSATSMWRKILMGLVGIAMTGCSSACCRPVVQYANPQPAPADADLQACANHAAAAYKVQDPRFQRLRLDTFGRVKMPLEDYVGHTYVSIVQDGQGQWYGDNEWRAVRFHCLSDGAGQVVYSFVRAK